MIESRSCPTGRVVARLASGGETRGRVRGCGRRVVVRLVAAIAVSWRRRVITVQMAGRASHSHMSACERERSLAVIKSRRLPGCG